MIENTKVSKTSLQNNSETVTNEERYISPEQKHKIIDDLSLI